MYAVSQAFMDAMVADRRQVDAKIVIDYTDPLIDQSIRVETSEQARISWPEQTADGLTQAPYMWASLDGTWTLDQARRPMPDTQKLASRYQVGWWGQRFAGIGGVFAEPYPTLTVTHTPRPVHSLKVVGENQFSEYPVDFTIRLRDGLGALLHEEIVTGNDLLTWSKAFDAPVLDVTSQELEVRKWSHEGRQVKILEFFTSVQETYYRDDIVEIRLLEEREVSQGSLPVGNISSNEISLRLANEGGKFDVTNRNSPLAGLLKPNRRIRAWLGIRGAGDLWGDGWYAPFDRDLAVARRDEAVREPLPGYVATLRPGEGRFGGAVAVEEGTENRFTNPSFNTSNSNGGWSHWGDSGVNGSYGQSTDKKYIYGNQQYAHWVANATDSSSHYFCYQVPTLNGQPSYRSLTVILCMEDGSEVTNDKVFPEANSTTSQGAPNRRWTSIKNIPGTIFYVCKWEGFHQTGADDLVGIGVSPGYKVYISFAQLEDKPFATSLVDGSREDGILAYPINLPDEHSIVCWRKSPTDTEYHHIVKHSDGTVFVDGEEDSDYDVGWIAGRNLVQRQYMLDWVNVVTGTDEIGHYYEVHISNIYPTPFPNLEFEENTQYTISGRVKWISGNANGLVFQYSDGTTQTIFRLYDTESFKEFTVTSAKGKTVTGIGALWSTGGRTRYYDLKLEKGSTATDWTPAPEDLGYNDDCPMFSNQTGLIDELLILPYAASEEHIARLYAQTRPLYDEWVPLGVFWSTDWDSEELEAMVRARDHMELLRRTTYEPGPLKQNVSLYELAQDVLTHAKMPPETYWLDPELQDIVVPWGWVPPGSHRDALRIIAEAALAVVYADRDGVVRIETLGSVPATPVVEITGDDYFPPLRAPSRQDQVANEIVVATQPLRPEDEPQQVYRSTTPITVPAGQTVTVQVRYNQPPVIEAQATLDNQPPGVSIVAATYYAWGAGITLQNSGATQADVSLVVTGRPLSVQGGEQAVARDQTSITENGVLRYEYPNNPLVQTLDQAQAIAQALLASAKDSRRDIEVEWRGNPALELGDPIAVVTDAERDRRSEYAVIRQELDWAGYLRARLTGRRI